MNITMNEIPKEELHLLTFPVEDVLEDDAEKHERSRTLHAATSLGNLEKHKVAIHFEDAIGKKVVNTTIWALTEKKILLKGGQSLPIHRIHQVDFI
jgi:hypothetical protein